MTENTYYISEGSQNSQNTDMEPTEKLIIISFFYKKIWKTRN